MQINRTPYCKTLITRHQIDCYFNRFDEPICTGTVDQMHARLCDEIERRPRRGVVPVRDLTSHAPVIYVRAIT